MNLNECRTNQNLLVKYMWLKVLNRQPSFGRIEVPSELKNLVRKRNVKEWKVKGGGRR